MGRRTGGRRRRSRRKRRGGGTGVGEAKEGTTYCNHSHVQSDTCYYVDKYTFPSVSQEALSTPKAVFFFLTTCSA